MNTKNVFFLGIIFILSYMIIAWIRYVDLQNDGEGQIAITGAFILLTIVGYNRFKKMGVDFNMFGFTDRPLFVRNFILIIFFGFIIFSINGFLEENNIFKIHQRDLLRFDDINFFGLLMMSLIFGAIAEEIAFRGIILKITTIAFGNRRNSIYGAIIIQAMLYGFMHLYQGVGGVIGATIYGLLFGILFLYCGLRLWPAIILHATFNLISITLLKYPNLFLS